MRKIILHGNCFYDIFEKENHTSCIEIASVIFWKRKIILHEREIASVILWAKIDIFLKI